MHLLFMTSDEGFPFVVVIYDLRKYEVNNEWTHPLGIKGKSQMKEN